MLAPVDRELIARIADIASKLLRETVRLRGDVVRLASRIEPFENDISIEVIEPDLPKPKTLKDAFEMLAQCRKQIEGCEYDLSSIRGNLDGIASDAISRADMKPWLRER